MNWPDAAVAITAIIVLGLVASLSLYLIMRHD